MNVPFQKWRFSQKYEYRFQYEVQWKVMWHNWITMKYACREKNSIQNNGLKHEVAFYQSRFRPNDKMSGFLPLLLFKNNADGHNVRPVFGTFMYFLPYISIEHSWIGCQQILVVLFAYNNNRQNSWMILHKGWLDLDCVWYRIDQHNQRPLIHDNHLMELLSLSICFSVLISMWTVFTAQCSVERRVEIVL